MPTRTRTTRGTEEEPAHDDRFEPLYRFDEDITDEDIEDFLSQQEEVDTKSGLINLPTMAGLATIGVGAMYLLERLGVFASGFDIGAILGPWLIGVLIILVGFGVLSWNPRRSRRAAARRAAARRRSASQRERTAQRERTPREPRVRQESTAGRSHSGRKQFVKSRTNRKLAGVCGGIGEYFGIDPTIVRIAFVIALIAGQGMALPIYLILAFVMPKPEPPRSIRAESVDQDDDDRVVVIRG
jgi:phage shock protein C